MSDCAQYRPISGQTHRERPLGVRVAQLAWLTLRLSCGHTCATKPAATPAVLAAVVATDPATDTPADTVPTCGSFESHFVQMFEATATDTALNDNLENMLHVRGRGEGKRGIRSGDIPLHDRRCGRRCQERVNWQKLTAFSPTHPPPYPHPEGVASNEE